MNVNSGFNLLVCLSRHSLNLIRTKCIEVNKSCNLSSQRDGLVRNDSDSDLVDGKVGVSINEMFLKWKKCFAESQVSEPTESIEYILVHVLQSKNVSTIYRQGNKILSLTDVKRVAEYCKLRLKRVPVQYIIEEWDFRDLTLKMKPPVFIPRPETEMLVDIVLSEINRKSANKVLEFCCGSGAISIALLKSQSSLSAIAIDKSFDACKLTELNAKLHDVLDRIKIIKCKIKDNVQIGDEKYDVIVSNPPYVFQRDWHHLQPEIKLYEDRDAFNGGADGLAVIKPILKASSLLLNYGGKLFMEVDTRHPSLITSWLRENHNFKLKLIKIHKDFYCKERFLEILKEM